MSQAIKRAMGLVIVLAAFAAVSAPAASARFDLNPPSVSEPAQIAPATSDTPSSTGSASGFDFGDAAIGAGVALGLVALGGAALLVSRRGQAKSRPATTS